MKWANLSHRPKPFAVTLPEVEADVGHLPADAAQFIDLASQTGLAGRLRLSCCLRGRNRLLPSFSHVSPPSAVALRTAGRTVGIVEPRRHHPTLRPAAPGCARCAHMSSGRPRVSSSWL